jgi:hypothetical protein
MPCPGPRSPQDELDFDGLRDYHDFNRYSPTRIYAPRSKSELVSALIEIEASGQRARSLGSNMSFSAITRSDHAVIKTDALDKHLSMPLGAGTVSWPANRFRNGDTTNRFPVLVKPEILSRGPCLVYVEAGIKIKDLLKDLAATSAPGLALPAMGAGGLQSLAGSLATATHGSEMDRQPLIDAIRAVHLIGPGGQEWWLERTNGFSESIRVASTVPEWCPDTRAVYDDRMFYSAIVSAGRLGVIYAMVLELEPAYWLDERRRREDYTIVRQQLILSAQFGFSSPVGVLNRSGAPLIFFQFILNLNSQAQCWVVERRIHTGPRAQLGLGPGALQSLGFSDLNFCTPLPPGDVFRIASALGAAVATAAAVTPGILAIGVTALTVATVIVTTVAAVAITRGLTIGDVIAIALRFAPGATGPLIDAALEQVEGNPPQKIGPSELVLDQTGTNTAPSCVQSDQIEYFFNARSPTYLNFVDQICALARNGPGVPGYVNIRFTQHSDAYIAMQQFPMTAAVEVVVLRQSAVGVGLLRAAAVLAAQMGGIPHWGKRIGGLPHSVFGLPATSIECFRYAIAMTENWPTTTFSSVFTREAGLDRLVPPPPPPPLPPIPPESAAILDRKTSTNRISLAQLFAIAQVRLAMPVPPRSILELARQYPPSLRMNADGVPLVRGKAASPHPRVQLRDLSRRFL